MQTYEVHPETVKQFKRGHPWVLADEFTERFPKNSSGEFEFIELKNPSKGNSSLGFFINDSDHPKIKARFWSKLRPKLEEELSGRLLLAWRRNQKYREFRENSYLCYGEADGLPGLFILLFKDIAVVRYEMGFWGRHQNLLQEILLRPEFELTSLIFQSRMAGQQAQLIRKSLEENSNLVIKERNCLFQIDFERDKDFGLFIDMASLRRQLSPYFKKSKHQLNLFSYTGAMSLPGLLYGNEVTSVDLSRSHMEWLEQNLELNATPSTRHRAIISSVSHFLKRASDEKLDFDLIICDPPSRFFDGKVVQSVDKFYRQSFSAMAKRLNRGGTLVVFQNTHSKRRKTWLSGMKELGDRAKLRFVGDLKTGEDAPVTPGFPEGDVIKGSIFQKMS